MVFFSDKPEKIGPKIASKLSKELHLPGPLPYETTIQGEGRKKEMGEALRTVGILLAGGSMRPLHTFDFAIDSPRSFGLRVHIVKGASVMVGTLFYQVRLNVTAPGTVWLEDEKIFGKSKFVGDEALSQRLNEHPLLLKLVNGFVRSSYRQGQVKAPRSVRLEPGDHGAVLSVSTLPRTAWPVRTKFDAMVFAEIADTVERALSI